MPISVFCDPQKLKVSLDGLSAKTANLLKKDRLHAQRVAWWLIWESWQTRRSERSLSGRILKNDTMRLQDS